MKKTAYATLAALLLSVTTAQAQTTCVTDTPFDGPALMGAIVGTGTPFLPGTWNGSGSLPGTASCPDAPLPKAFDPSDTLAVSAALATPVWLEPGETFALSGGLGFSDGATALGATGVLRFSKNLSGYAGGAVSTDNSDLWSGRVGLRLGF